MIGLPLSAIIGLPFEQFITEYHRFFYNSLFKTSWSGDCKGEVEIFNTDRRTPVQLSLTVLELAEGMSLSIIITDLTLQKTTQRKLEENNRQLEHLNQTLEASNHDLQQFASVASHDLQEPLRKIQTFSARILEKETLSEAGKDYFKRIQNAANRMQKLIQDLLTFSRVTTGERKHEHVLLTDIVEDVIKEYAEKLHEKNAKVETQGLGEVYAIAFQFRQLMLNLFGNSIKFARPDVPLRITVSSKMEKAEEIIDRYHLPSHKVTPEKVYCHIAVTDNGIGFEPQFNDRIFEVFQRLHGNDKYSGTGIGLSIVKKIVENHNGVITANGELNNGARFDIYIPYENSP
jgi:signal transduction histidine kinase